MKNEEKFRTAEERTRAFESQHCERYDDCAQCQYNSSCGGNDSRTIGLRIMAHWLALEAEEEKPENCPFCGGDCRIETGFHYDNVVSCTQCDYISGGTHKDTESNSISAHNRVARAVRTSQESDGK